ncbi:SDR family oxidoreductase [Streptomyces indicus]|uniref:Uncharacterized conserved protein YbjT, contains NAD(P)-binding and DUF2867 domains n=1 Tax=Streptomyces indicus TaxID=417292 RepID=A0A1G9DTZ6_9ACTN|nr:NAD(P)H-binding protein [Streptomyces indicus]SDK67368.1 Uncharacterized conserved protein YbjT, contains NAD(P)-binding and DUF2867 domains [Streptomyces indicus]
MILVTAATAPVGRSVVEQLAGQGVGVRALTREPERAGLPEQAEVVQGDLGDAGSLREALRGVDGVFLLAASPAFDAGAFAKAAKEAGVRRIVFQSSGAIEEGVEVQSNPVAGFHEAIERALAGSGVDCTFLRLAVESSGSLEWSFDVAGQLAAGDVVRGPSADAVETPIHPADFAAVVIAALRDERDEEDKGDEGDEGDEGERVRASRVYPVTGPHRLSLAEQVRLIGEALNRSVTYEELSEAEAAEAISPYAPAEVLLGTWARHVASPPPVADTLHRLTGTAGRSSQEWAAHTAARLAS